MKIFDVVLLVTSEDRDDGSGADHGKIPRERCQWQISGLAESYLQEDRAMASHGTVSEANV